MTKVKETLIEKVSSSAVKVVDTQKESMELAMKFTAGKNGKDIITAILSSLVPLPEKAKEVLADVPVLNDLVFLALGDIINNVSAQSHQVDAVIKWGSVANKVEILEQFNVDKIGKIVAEKIAEIKNINLLDKFNEKKEEIENQKD